jgi:hypothetical protein
MQSLVSFVLTGIGVSTVLCLPILLNLNGTNSNAQDALTNQSMGDGSDVAVFGIRGPLTGQPLIGQSAGALNASSTKDTDGDLLPDALEWTLLSDPTKKDTDGDGISDFVEAVEFTSPIERNSTGAPVDSYRLLFATTLDSKTQQRFLWCHSLIRLASGDIKDLKAVNLFFSHNNVDIDLTSLFYTHTKEVLVVKDAAQGLLIRVAVRMPMPVGFEKLAPGSFASHALINSSILTASAQMFYLGSAFHTFAMVNSKAMILQSAGSGEARTTFWRSGQACVLTLEVIGSSPGWRICEVKKADCKVVYRGSCSPSCLKSTGAAVLVADGTPLVEGG